MQKLTIAVLSILFLSGTSAIAQDYPNLVGTWRGISETIVSGQSNHFPADGDEIDRTPRMVSIPLTIIIDRQDGHRYSGELVSPNSDERIVGVIARSGRIHWVDEDGFVDGELIDENTMEICYRLVEPTIQLASCLIVEREF